MIDPQKYGVSFSIKQCQAFGLDPRETLDWLLARGWRRFRLMSYWDEHEKLPGNYDFCELDWQIARITKAGGVITLCLGVKQPRWPEYHWPEWAFKLDRQGRSDVLLPYVEAVVNRYMDEPAVISYQLENEALLKGFGRHIDIDRARLRAEYSLIRRLDPARPIIMSTSNGWGLPLRAPRPDSVGFSLYTIVHSHGRYHPTIQTPLLHMLRRMLIRWLVSRPVFIHELQCEPWGPKPIWHMTAAQQDESMPAERIRQNITWARRIGAYPIDLWGAEWWYHRWLQGDKTIAKTVQATVRR